MDTATILNNLNIQSLNQMQIESINNINEHPEIVLLSNTGSGKTLAFLIPLIQRLNIENLNKTQALILVPSRELALQIESVLKKIQPGCKISCCYGGHKREIEENNLLQAPTIIIATTGRCADHLRRGNIKYDSIDFLVIDEYDKILETDFQEEMKFILDLIGNIKYKILTSATHAISIPEFVKLNNNIVLNYITEHKPDDVKLKTYRLLSDDKDKINTLFKLICSLKDTSSIVFCNHRDSVERVHQLLSELGILNVFYHGGMEQIDREIALCKFRNSSSNILITTDLASRGLDISNVRSVIHYHLPLTEDAFVHRNGRTARMDATGNIFVIIGPDEESPEYINNISDSFSLPESYTLPEKPKWSTLFIDAGKKDKINKIDIVGFLTQKGKLKKDEIGLIEVKDFIAFAAVRKSKIGSTVELVKNEKIKNKKVKIAVAK